MKRLALAAALLASTAIPAAATLQIAVDVNGVASFCADNSACDSNSAVGSLAVNSLLLNGVTVSGSLSQSFGTPANPGTDFLNTSSLQVTNISGALRTITVAVSDTDFHYPAWAWFTAGSGTWARAGTLSNITMNWFGDALNRQGASTAFDTPGNLLDTFSDTSNGVLNNAFSHNGSGNFATQLTDPFSMTEQSTFTLVNGGELINRGQSIAAIPEPSTWAMLALGFGGLAFLGAKRARKGRLALLV